VTQLWIALHALADTLSRNGRPEDVVLLLGAHAASERAAPPFGADAELIAGALETARASLGDRFDAVYTEGAALGDARAIALARRLATER
jgi:hypothetical protein